MFHYFNSLTNTHGDALIGYFVKVTDSASGDTVPLYADENSTPIVSVSGLDDAAMVDSDGNISFYLDNAGQYDLNIYATDGSTLVRTVPNMALAVGPQGPRGFPGGAFASVLDYGAAGDGTTDDSAAIQAAIDDVGTKGGTLYFPEGVYLYSTTLTLANKVRYLGAGVDTAVTKGTVLKYTGTSDAIQINNPSNSTTNANILIENLAVNCTTLTAGKACLADNGSGQLKIRGCVFGGADRLVILDQSEESDILDCDLEVPATGTCGVWIVNGGDRTVGNSSGFSNRISVVRCQINGSSAGYGILDDGGTTHSFVDNNYNGCLNNIRVAGVNTLKIGGGEFESAGSHNIRFEATTLDTGRSCGGCGSVLIENPEITPTGAHACVYIASSTSPIMFIGGFYGNTTSAKVVGTANVNTLYALGMSSGGGGGMFDAMADNHWEVGNNGLGAIALTTNVPMLAQTSITPAFNGGMVIQKTSDTSLTFKVKGSDGTVRSASLTLS